MKRIKKRAGLYLIFLLCIGLAACTSQEKSYSSEMEKLQEINQIPDDGIITEEQMKTIAGEEGEYRFCGSGEGYHYVWIYNGKMIKNPQEQNLKVTLDNQKVETVKKAADDASVGIGIHLETMHMAAPATLEITLEEAWDADTVICCKYWNDKAYKMNDVKINVSGSGDTAETTLTFQVAETGDTYYLVGGKSSGRTDEQAGGTQAQKQADREEGQLSDNINAVSGDAGTTNGAGSSTDGQKQPAQSSSSHICTISIECSTILNNWPDLDESKAEFVPSDGWILYPSEVEFTPGETVFDVLKRVCGETGIHMSSRYTPVYGSYYIEGINQLYEFDCSANSGWMYWVNGWYPNYGCSAYEVNDGDYIEWKYTCDLGSDIGGGEY